MPHTGPVETRAAKAKILATLGPASDSPEIIQSLIEAGADGFRLNFSHGTAEWHQATAATVREVAGDRPVAIVADLQGPRIRIGALPEPVVVNDGDEIALASGEADLPDDALPTTYDALAADVEPGDRILIDNGLIELTVLETDGSVARCRVVIGGEIGRHKGINLPGVSVSAPALTDKDRADVATAVGLGADAIALSFVRRASDVEALRNLLQHEHQVDTPIISKIEHAEGLENFDEILASTDGVMVARGDLGVELAEEKVPAAQKRIIAQANAAGKPVITATEMLQSMIASPRPTRAEASDVANAILDGTDAVMLSGETAVGRYPARTVATMERITLEAEGIRREFWAPVPKSATTDFSSAAAEAACSAAAELGAVAVVVFTMSGRTARLVAQRRPMANVVALTPSSSTRRRLSLVWGVSSLEMPEVDDADEMVTQADALLKEHGLVQTGETVVIVGGTGPLTGATNFTKMHRVR
jgi:pyruvate kinase